LIFLRSPALLYLDVADLLLIAFIQKNTIWNQISVNYSVLVCAHHCEENLEQSNWLRNWCPPIWRPIDTKDFADKSMRNEFHYNAWTYYSYWSYDSGNGRNAQMTESDERIEFRHEWIEFLARLKKKKLFQKHSRLIVVMPENVNSRQM
jgi:hypothetical protein